MTNLKLLKVITYIFNISNFVLNSFSVNCFFDSSNCFAKLKKMFLKLVHETYFEYPMLKNIRNAYIMTEHIETNQWNEIYWE